MPLLFTPFVQCIPGPVRLASHLIQNFANQAERWDFQHRVHERRLRICHEQHGSSRGMEKCCHTPGRSTPLQIGDLHACVFGEFRYAALSFSASLQPPCDLASDANPGVIHIAAGRAIRDEVAQKKGHYYPKERQVFVERKRLLCFLSVRSTFLLDKSSG